MKRNDYYHLWRIFKRWMNKFFKRDNDKDDYFDHPFAIF